MSSSKPSRRRAWLLAAVSALLALGAAELGIRLFAAPRHFLDESQTAYWEARFALVLDSHISRGTVLGNVTLDPELGWRMTPGYDAGGQTTNSRGMRGATEFPFEKPPGVRRLALLGDSFTYGFAVGNDACWAALLRETLPKWEVLNFGANGYGLGQVYLWWEREASRYGADVVLLSFFVPDFHRSALAVRRFPKPRYVIRDGELALTNSPVPTLPEYRDHHVLDERNLLRLTDLLEYAARRVRSREPDAQFDAKAAVIVTLLERLNASVEDSGARLALAIIPHHWLRDYPDHERIVEVVGGTAERLGVPVLDLTDGLVGLREKQPAGVIYGPEDHWTPAAHEWGAARLTDFLRADKLVD